MTLDKKDRNILQWLSPVDPSESHRATTDLYQEGTSGWIVQCGEFCDWFRASGGVLWLSGFRKSFTRKIPPTSANEYG